MKKLIDSLSYQPVELAFGTSGLRGLVTDMTDLECYINTKGFITFLQSQPQTFDTIFIAGDLRDSTPRILRAVAMAIVDSGLKYVYCGLIPTPALAYFAQQKNAPGIMVTGSHIPADRNGIKFYKVDGEVLKSDEVAIHGAVAAVREEIYSHEVGQFNESGASENLPELSDPVHEATDLYTRRYLDFFEPTSLKDKHIVMYQHSAVGRDIIPDILKSLGATVTTVGRSDVFIPIDTENVTPDDQAYFRELANKYPDAFAIVSTDGDSDRPFVIDETGVFHRGDVLGLPTTELLGIKAVAFPISSSDAVSTELSERGIAYIATRIGSPYVIDAMRSLSKDQKPVAGWEVNGGYLLGTAITNENGSTLEALPTRDALLPILGALLLAIKKGVSITQLFAAYPQRFTQAGIIDNFPSETSQSLLELLSTQDAAEKVLSTVLESADGFTVLEGIDTTDGARLVFTNQDIMHIRPSGNAPQLRVYATSDTQARADDIVKRGIAEPDGILRRLENTLTKPSR